jgi:hypothetical protein
VYLWCMPAGAVPEERRIYTDGRFPDLEVHNFGSPTFVILEKDPTTGSFHEIDQFVAFEKPGVDFVSEPFAQRRAKACFDLMAKHGPVMAGPEDDTVPSNRLNWQPRQQGVNPLAGMREMTPQDVDSVIAAARAEQDPEKRKALFQQATSMMAQQESAAQRVVRILLSL